MTIFRSKGVLLIALLVAACAKQVSDRELICDDMPGLLSNSPRGSSTEQYALVEQCVHKWGARFAVASGSNSELARAAIYRCSDAIADYYRLLDKEDPPSSAASKQVLESKFADMALMRVIQQRAGQCSLKAKL